MLRIAALEAFTEAARTGRALTWRDVGELLQARGLMHVQSRSEARLLRLTVANMVQAGELMATGLRRCPGSRRPMTLYRLVGAAGQDAGDAAQTLRAVLSGWRG